MNASCAFITKVGDRVWTDAQGRKHREGLPALVFKDGSQFWFRHGQRHRDDGPAFVGVDGTLGWWRDDQRHREDGPAVIRPDGTTQWWIAGTRLTQDEIDERVAALQAAAADAVPAMAPRRQRTRA